jgi:hypothetical protein
MAEYLVNYVADELLIARDEKHKSEVLTGNILRQEQARPKRYIPGQ